MNSSKIISDKTSRKTIGKSGQKSTNESRRAKNRNERHTEKKMRKQGKEDKEHKNMDVKQKRDPHFTGTAKGGKRRNRKQKTDDTRKAPTGTG